MTFYKELQKVLHNKGEGAFVLIQGGGEYYCIFSPTKDDYGNYRYSDWWSTKEEAKKNIGFFAGYTEKGINSISKEEDWKIIKTYLLKDLI